MKIPGEILKKYVKFGSPQLNGKYLCWIKPQDTPKMSVIPIAPIKVKTFENNYWIEPEQIIAWIGPLPVYSIDELFNEGQEADLIAYAIGTKEGAKKHAFKQGPFSESLDTQFQYGKPGDYVYELRPNALPKIIKYWDLDEQKWAKFKGSQETNTKAPKVRPKKTKGFKRLKKNKKGKDSFWWIKGTKKEAAKEAIQGYKNKPKLILPITELPGETKGEIIWNCSVYWALPFPEFIWDGKEWKKPTLDQVQKIQNVVKRLMTKYGKNKKKKKTNSVTSKRL